MYRVIKSTKEGGQTVCFLPKDPRPPQKIKPQPKQKTQIESSTNRDKSNKNMLQVKNLLSALWTLAKPLLSGLREKYPEVTQLIDALESSGLVTQLMGLLTNNNQ